MSSPNSAQEWSCSSCSEEIELQFDRCWKCGSDKDGKINDDFHELLSSHSETQSADKGSGISWSALMLIWVVILTIPLGIVFAWIFFNTGVLAAFVISSILFTLANFAFICLVVLAIYSLAKRADC